MRIVVIGALVGAMLVAPALAAESDVTFTEVAAKLAAPAVLRGNFTQTRKIAIIERPLLSKGQFILSDLGLYWQQDQPLTAIMIADGERLLQQLEDGPLQSIDVAQNPVVLTFSSSFLSIFRGSEAELRSNFDVVFTGDTDLWAIQLTPVSYPMSEAIDSIILRGREYIEELTVTSLSSDETMISFSNLQTEPDQLTENELELYAR